MTSEYLSREGAEARPWHWAMWGKAGVNDVMYFLIFDDLPVTSSGNLAFALVGCWMLDAGYVKIDFCKYLKVSSSFYLLKTVCEKCV